MNFIKKIENDIKNDPLKTFKVFERLIAAVCVSIPAFLWLADDRYPHFRGSISAYAYMPNSYIFGMLLCMAAMLFIFNGAVYFRNETSFGLDKSGKWYNVVLGVSLLGVILFPCGERFEILHYVFAIIFFLGNALVIGVFHHRRDRVISILLAVSTVISFVFCYFSVFSLFWAEWASLMVIAVHFILQSMGVITFSMAAQQKTNVLKQPKKMRSHAT